MNEHQRETAFLRHCLRYDDSAEHQALDGKIQQIQRDERSLRRGMWLMAWLTALMVVGLGYGAVLIENFPEYTTQLIARILSAIGLASMVCLLVFVGLRVIYRRKLDLRREECRQMVMRFLDSRLGRQAGNHRRQDNMDVNRETSPAARNNGSSSPAESAARG